jgi:hypothetical protein
MNFPASRPAIRGDGGLRTPDVTMPGSPVLRAIQPLLDAGLHVDEIRDLLFRVSFACLATAGQCDVSDATAFLGPQPAAVRAAWIETVDRMLRDPEMSTGPLC